MVDSELVRIYTRRRCREAWRDWSFAIGFFGLEVGVDLKNGRAGAAKLVCAVRVCGGRMESVEED